MKMSNQNLRYISVWLILSALYGCTNFRSAEGMRKSEIGINYIFPSSGSVRYGLTETIESRLIFSKLDRKDQCFNTDIFYHPKLNWFDFLKFGLMLGYWHNNTTKSNYYYGLTASHKINDYWVPYISLNSKNTIYNSGDSFPGYFSIGSEIQIPLNENKTLNLNLVPEGLFILRNAGEFFDGPTFISISAGFSVVLNN